MKCQNSTNAAKTTHNHWPSSTGGGWARCHPWWPPPAHQPQHHCGLRTRQRTSLVHRDLASSPCWPTMPAHLSPILNTNIHTHDPQQILLVNSMFSLNQLEWTRDPFLQIYNIKFYIEHIHTRDPQQILLIACFHLTNLHKHVISQHEYKLKR